MQKLLTDYRALYYEREKSGKNASQRDLILNLLKDGFYHNCHELMALGVSQYGARVYELRKRGNKIENVTIDKETYFILNTKEEEKCQT